MVEQPPFAPPIARLLWRDGLDALPPWRARGLHVLRLLYAVVRDVAEGYLTLHAAGLVYASLLSFVPLLAFSFSVLKGLGVHNQLEPMLYSALAPLGDDAQEITNQILGFVDNIQVGVLGAIGLGLLVYTTISVVQRLERAFNEIWHVVEARTMLRKFTDYVSVILVGPLLMFTALGLTASLQSSELVQQISAIQPFGTAIKEAGRMVPYVLVVTSLTFVYIFVPNTRVRIGPAFTGALIGGVLWAFAGSLFARFVAGSGSYAAIYSAFATIILFIFWLYISWLILLIGAAISFYLQRPANLAAGPGSHPDMSACRTRERLALRLMATVGRAYYDGTEAPSVETLVAAVGVPRDPIQNILGALERAQLVYATGDDPPRYAPGRPPDTTPVKAVLDAVRRPSADLASGHVAVDQKVLAIEETIDRAVEDALKTQTIKDLILPPAQGLEPPQGAEPAERVEIARGRRAGVAGGRK